MKINFTFFPLSLKLYLWISLYYHGTAQTQILSAVSYIRRKSLLFSPSPLTTSPIQATCLIFLRENDLILLTSTLPTTAPPHSALQCSQKDVFKI